MSNVGKVFTSYGSGLWANPLGVAQIGFNGYDLGKTGQAATMTTDQDVLDIVYQQTGTKPDDKVITGQVMLLTTVLAEVSTEMLKEVFAYNFASAGSVGSDSGVAFRTMYTSMRDNYAKPLKVVSVDGDGIASADTEDTMLFYEAWPMINGDLINWDNATQRAVPIQFFIWNHEFATGESSTYNSAFGYWGDPTAEDVPAVDWPNLTGPQLVTAVASAATTVTLTFDTALTLVGGVTLANQVSIKVNGEFITPTTAVISSTAIDVTLPAASIASGDTVLAYVSADSVEDSGGYNNLAIDARIVTNSVP